MYAINLKREVRNESIYDGRGTFVNTDENDRLIFRSKTKPP